MEKKSFFAKILILISSYFNYVMKNKIKTFASIYNYEKFGHLFPFFSSSKI